jgi:RNA polymerase sigma-70 factor, ECF subfamily
MRQRSADRLTQEDRRRFEEIFLPYLDAAYNVARWIIRHDQDAQDVVQDAYVRAFKGFQRFRGGGGWLDLLANRPLAAIVYEYENHFINVFVWPARDRD